MRDGLPDPAETHDAERPSGDAAAELIRWPPSSPATGAQASLARAEPAQGHQDQRDREVRRTIGEDIRCVRDRQSGAPGGIQRDMIDARAEVGENPAAMRPRQQHVGPEWIEEGAENAVGFFECPTQFRSGVPRIIRIQSHLE